MKLKYFSIFFSILGILILYIISKLSQIPLIELSEMPDYEGRQVILEGVVSEYRFSRQGNQFINIKKGNDTAIIFNEGETEIEQGDTIQAIGEVQKYGSDWELIVSNNNNIKILKKWHNGSVSLWQLAENPLKYLNLNVNVTGYIESISNTYFYIVDLEKNYCLVVFYKLTKNISILPGQKVNVLGKLSFDKEKFRYQLELYEEQHDIIYIKQE
ncbi:hypothetical protein AYK20_08060 [Thermoplasmatales archaeon SG8-52-1]|nr:MAG: hypothetical protein AYK20_08060 [Thermoplasmatales archaeon SG8-52-1]